MAATNISKLLRIENRAIFDAVNEIVCDVQCDGMFTNKRYDRMYIREVLEYGRLVSEQLCEGFQGFEADPWPGDKMMLRQPNNLIYFFCDDGQWYSAFNGKFDRLLEPMPALPIGDAESAILDSIYYGADDSSRNALLV
ncbi:MAG TPA: hypothetical protein VHD36_12485 [Pirellulales bacterium]|nr:hypothetical protein [Pirellulales bacterium]